MNTKEDKIFIIVAFAFGKNDNADTFGFMPNMRIAFDAKKIALTFCKKHPESKVIIFAQQDIHINLNQKSEHVENLSILQMQHKKYLSTDCIAQCIAKKVHKCKKNKNNTKIHIISVSAPQHSLRCVNDLINNFLCITNIFIRDAGDRREWTSESYYSKNSQQWWTRGPVRWWIREIPLLLLQHFWHKKYQEITRSEPPKFIELH